MDLNHVSQKNILKKSCTGTEIISMLRRLQYAWRWATTREQIDLQCLKSCLKYSDPFTRARIFQRRIRKMVA